MSFDPTLDTAPVVVRRLPHAPATLDAFDVDLFTGQSLRLPGLPLSEVRLNLDWLPPGFDGGDRRFSFYTRAVSPLDSAEEVRQAARLALDLATAIRDDLEDRVRVLAALAGTEAVEVRRG